MAQVDIGNQPRTKKFVGLKFLRENSRGCPAKRLKLSGNSHDIRESDDGIVEYSRSSEGGG